MEWLAGELHGIFEREGASLLGDPWRPGTATIPRSACCRERPSPRALELLEMERNALRLFTSCAWFFDDLAGIEPVQVLRYGARAIELAGPAGGALEAGFIEHLARAKSNDAEVGNGRDLYLARVRPRLPAAVRVAGGLAALADVAEDPGAALPAAWEARVHGVGPARYSVELVHRRTRATAHAEVACRWAAARMASSSPPRRRAAGRSTRPTCGIVIDPCPSGPGSGISSTRRWPSQRGQLADGVTTLPTLAPIALLDALGANSPGPIDAQAGPRRPRPARSSSAWASLSTHSPASRPDRADQAADPSALGELSVRLGFTR